MAKVPEIFEKMRQCQVEPDRITYSTLIKGYCVAGELEPAFKLFEELKRDGKLDLDEIAPRLWSSSHVKEVDSCMG